MPELDIQSLISVYQTQELKHFHKSSFHLRKAFKPLAHLMEGDPTLIKSPLELGFFADTMHESSFADSLLKLQCLTDLELVVLEEIISSIWKNSKGFHQQCFSINSILRHLYQYRLIDSNLSGVSSFLEIGPGSGYLPLFLAKLKPQASIMTLEVTQSLYLYQSWLYHQFGVLLETLGNESFNIANSLTRGKILHLPWWTFIAEESLQKDIEALVINHAICELHPYALDRILKFSVNNNCRYVFIEGLGLQKYFHNLAQIIDKLLEYGFTDIQNLGEECIIATQGQPGSTPSHPDNRNTQDVKAFLQGLPFVTPFWREVKKMKSSFRTNLNLKVEVTQLGQIEAFLQMDSIVTRVTGMNIAQIFDFLYDHVRSPKGLILNTHNSSKYSL